MEYPASTLTESFDAMLTSTAYTMMWIMLNLAILIGVPVVVFKLFKEIFRRLTVAKPEAGPPRGADQPGPDPYKSSVPAANYTEENKQKVIGWERASADDLRALPPGKLQDKLDRDNPFADRILQLRDLIPDFQGSTNKRHQRRYDKMVVQLQQLREQPEEIDRKALTKYADQAILGAKQDIQSVERLSED